VYNFTVDYDTTLYAYLQRLLSSIRKHSFPEIVRGYFNIALPKYNGTLNYDWF